MISDAEELLLTPSVLYGSFVACDDGLAEKARFCCIPIRIRFEGLECSRFRLSDSEVLYKHLVCALRRNGSCCREHWMEDLRIRLGRAEALDHPGLITLIGKTVPVSSHTMSHAEAKEEMSVVWSWASRRKSPRPRPTFCTLPLTSPRKGIVESPSSIRELTSPTRFDLNS